MKTDIDAVLESADFGPSYAGADYYTVTFRVPKDTIMSAGKWKLVRMEVGTFEWAKELPRVND